MHTNQIFVEKLELADRVYTNCTIRMYNFWQASVLFASGGKLVAASDLPTNVLERLGVNLVAIEKRKAVMAERNRLLQEQDLKQIELENLQSKISAAKYDSRKFDDGIFSVYDGDLLEGKVTQVLEDNKILVWLQKKNSVELEPLHIVLKNYFRQTFDEALVKEHARLVGTYKYTTINDAKKTVLLYDCGISYEDPTLPDLVKKADGLKEEIEKIKTDLWRIGEI